MKKTIPPEPNPPDKKARRPGIPGIAVILILVLLTGELLFRMVFPLPEVKNFNRIMYTPLKTAAEMKTSPWLSNASFYSTSQPDGVQFLHILNLYGFRDKDWRVRKRTRRVMFIGDSFVEGFMTKDEETIPTGFAREGEKDGISFEVMNLGVSATKLHHYFQLLRDAVPLFQPDDVIVVLYENDFPSLPYDPGWLAKPLEPRYNSFWLPRVVSVVKAIVEGKPAALTWTRKPFQYFAPVPDPANPWTMKEAQLSPMVKPDIAKAMKAGLFNPFVVNEINGAAGRLDKPINVEPHLAALRHFTDRYHARLFLVYMPGRLQVSDYYVQYSQRFSRHSGIQSLRDQRYRTHALTLARTAASLSLPFLDLTPAIEAREIEGKHCYWDYDLHMRGDGYLYTANIIYSWWKTYTEKNERS